MTFLLILKKMVSFGLFRRPPSERTFSKVEIRLQELQFNYNFPFDAMKQAFSTPTKCRASFSRPLSTSGTAVVAKSNPPSVAPQTDAILIKRPLQLYFSRTFRQISFSGYILAVFNAYQVEGCFFGRLNLRGFSIKLRPLKTE